VLARLETVPGIEEARVDWTGAYFLLKLAPTADTAAIPRLSGAVLGSDPVRLDTAAEEAHIAAFRRGEPWMRSGETLRLSGEEARVWGGRIADDTARDAGLDDAKSRSLKSLFQSELLRAFERAHASEGSLSERLSREWPALLQHTLEECRGFLSEEETSRVGDILRKRFGGSR